jgi:hypothetical protein
MTLSTKHATCLTKHCGLVEPYSDFSEVYAGMFKFQISNVFCTCTVYTFHTATCIKMAPHKLSKLRKPAYVEYLSYSSEFLLFLVKKADIPVWVALGETRDLIRFTRRTEGSIAGP